MAARPLIVEVDLASPWVDRGDPIHFDALIIEAVCRRNGSPEVTRLTPVERIGRVQTPIAEIEAMGLRCPLATAAEAIVPVAPALVHLTKRRDAEDWMHLAAAVNVAAGPDRDRLVRTEARVAAGLRWYTWGHRASVLDLLRLLWGPSDRPTGFVGSMRRAGAGQITGWRVEVGSHDPERCLLRDGLAARHLPSAWVTRADRWRRGAWAAPYWHPGRQEQVPWVGVVVDLHPEVHAALTRITCP